MKKQKENIKLANEVLDFLSKESEKTIRCQCGYPRQKVGFICDSCGEVVIQMKEMRGYTATFTILINAYSKEEATREAKSYVKPLEKHIPIALVSVK